MPLGSDRPLYVLPFDHRHSYGAEVFGFREPMTKPQIAAVAASKQVIYDGFEQALARGVPRDKAGILVDEEFGADILRDAASKQYITALSLEKSGQNEFDFEYGDQFAAHLDAFQPTFAKVLVRFNVEGDAAMNARQAARLRRVSDYLRGEDRKFMFELLVPPEAAQLTRVSGDRSRYDVEVRPGLVERAMIELQDAGIEPDVWKIEGLDRTEDCRMVAAAARRDGRQRVSCIVLGRGEDADKVVQWLRVAAPVTGFIGFAVGRSTFLEAILALRQGAMTREQAVAQIADRYLSWRQVYEQASR